MTREAITNNLLSSPIRARKNDEDLGLTNAEAGFLVAALVNVSLSSRTVVDLEWEIEKAAPCFILDGTSQVDAQALICKIKRFPPQKRLSLIAATALYYELDMVSHDTALAAVGLANPENFRKLSRRT